MNATSSHPPADHRATRPDGRPRWNTWRRLAAVWWIAREAWHHLQTGPLHPLAAQVPLGQPRDHSHPTWCSQGGNRGGCHRVTVARDGTVEWAHGQVFAVEHLDGVADVCALRMDAVLPGGAHYVTKAIVMDCNGSFAVDQAEAFGLAVLEAVRLYDAGLDGTPGGVPAVLELLPRPAAAVARRVGGAA